MQQCEDWVQGEGERETRRQCGRAEGQCDGLGERK